MLPPSHGSDAVVAQKRPVPTPHPIPTPPSFDAFIPYVKKKNRTTPVFPWPNCQAGLQLPPETNPADWILDMTTSSQTLPDGKTLAEAYRQRKDKSPGVSKAKLAASAFTCLFYVCVHLNFLAENLNGYSSTHSMSKRYAGVSQNVKSQSRRRLLSGEEEGSPATADRQPTLW